MFCEGGGSLSEATFPDCRKTAPPAQTLSRRQLLVAAGAGAASLAFPKLASSARSFPLGDSVVLQWNEAFLQGVRNSRLGPPMVARALAIAHTSIYDAWAAYDNRAVGTRLGGSLRRPARERTVEITNQAISFAAYRAAVDLFPGSRSSVFDPLMQNLGFNAADQSTDTTTSTGIGNVAAQAVLDLHHRDGANQLGDEPGGVVGVPYSDYTGYVAANDAMDIRLAFDPATVLDPDAWQPLRYVDGTGAVVTPGFVGAQWQRVTTFAVRPGSLRSSTGPARFGSAEYVAQAQALVEISAGLTDKQKMIAEYWADGPHSELPPGHWNLFAQFVSRRDHHGEHTHQIERDVKLFFALTNAVSDAGCCAWDNKRAFNSVRPITAIRTLFRGQMVRAWGGPYPGGSIPRVSATCCWSWTSRARRVAAHPCPRRTSLRACAWPPPRCREATKRQAHRSDWALPDSPAVSDRSPTSRRARPRASWAASSTCSRASAPSRPHRSPRC